MSIQLRLISTSAGPLHPIRSHWGEGEGCEDELIGVLLLVVFVVHTPAKIVSTEVAESTHWFVVIINKRNPDLVEQAVVPDVPYWSGSTSLFAAHRVESRIRATRSSGTRLG